MFAFNEVVQVAIITVIVGPIVGLGPWWIKTKMEQAFDEQTRQHGDVYAELVAFRTENAVQHASLREATVSAREKVADLSEVVASHTERLASIDAALKTKERT